jgi:FdhD protein
MRTPGNDFELAAGFLFTEGLITSQADVRDIRYCSVPRAEQHYNVVSVTVTRALELEAQRNFYATSSCGICGKASLDLIDVQCAPIPDGPLVQGTTIVGLPGELRRAQSLFDQTGGLHAAALFDPTGRLISARAAPYRRVARLRPSQLRDHPEGRHRRHPDRLRGLGSLEPRSRCGSPLRAYADRLPP